MNRRRFIQTAATIGCSLAGLPLGVWAGRDPKPRNVLVIVLDTVRGDHYGRTPTLTPFFDQFAARGVRFDRAWVSSSWSLPSHATIMTGRLPHEHGADWPELRLDSSVPTLASFLSSHGYVTGAFSSNSAWVTPAYLNHGFHRFQAYSLEDHLRRTTLGRIANRAARTVGAHEAGRGRKADQVHEQFLDFIDTYSDPPFFGYLCHMDVNQAFHNTRLNRPFWAARPPVAEVTEAYDEALTALDAEVGRLLGELGQRGVLENTLVVITSDHGESFGPEHAGDHLPTGHGTSLFPEQTWVPLAIATPDKRFAGRVVSATVGNRAVPATIGRLLGLNHPFPESPLPMDPAWEADAPSERFVVQTLNYDEHRASAIVTDRWLLLRDHAAGQEMLFNLQSDPLCTMDLGTQHPEAVTLHARLETELMGRP